jgi:hypothetical protein
LSVNLIVFIINKIINRIVSIFIRDKIVKNGPILILSIIGRDIDKAISANIKFKKLFTDDIVAEFCCSFRERYEKIAGR